MTYLHKSSNGEFPYTLQQTQFIAKPCTDTGV